MSITAFPVLAHILEERDIQCSTLGTAAIPCAAVDDGLAWMLLAGIVALTGDGGSSINLPLRLADG